MTFGSRRWPSRSSPRRTRASYICTSLCAAAHRRAASPRGSPSRSCAPRRTSPSLRCSRLRPRARTPPGPPSPSSPSNSFTTARSLSRWPTVPCSPRAWRTSPRSPRATIAPRPIEPPRLLAALPPLE
eukprot:scaffold36446_cov35-Tisochrysis_lutea.AAC.1